MRIVVAVRPGKAGRTKFPYTLLLSDSTGVHVSTKMHPVQHTLDRRRRMPFQSKLLPAVIVFCVIVINIVVLLVDAAPADRPQLSP